MSSTSCWPTSPSGSSFTKTDHDKAVDRFEVMRDWIDRPGSPLHGLVALMYPQGSMAIGATIARCQRARGVRHRRHRGAPRSRGIPIPQMVLDALYHAIRGEPGSATMTRPPATPAASASPTKTACTSISTPAVLVDEREPRTSVIFHSKPEDPSVPKLRLLANPWGLAEWFKVMTPLETDFAKMFEGRAMAHDRAPGEPVPDQESGLPQVPRAYRAAAHQAVAQRPLCQAERAKLRRPPSVLLSKHFADHANRTTTLSEEVEHQARQLLLRLEAEKAVGPADPRGQPVAASRTC